MKLTGHVDRGVLVVIDAGTACRAPDDHAATPAFDQQPPSGAARAPDGGALVRIGPIAIDSRARRVTLAGRPLELTRGEYELLWRLAASPGRVFTKDELLRAQPGAAGNTRRLDTRVARLRRRLGDHRALLVTVWGVGYRLGGRG